MLKIELSALLAVALCAPLAAQWKVTDKGIPRLQNGEPNLSAPGIGGSGQNFRNCSAQHS